MNHSHQHEQGSRGGMKSGTKWILVGFFAIAAYFLITEHKAHLSGFLDYLPFVFLLACPLMHIFMHGGHEGHGGNERDNQGGRDDGTQKAFGPDAGRKNAKSGHGGCH